MHKSTTNKGPQQGVLPELVPIHRGLSRMLALQRRGVQRRRFSSHRWTCVESVVLCGGCRTQNIQNWKQACLGLTPEHELLHFCAQNPQVIGKTFRELPCFSPLSLLPSKFLTETQGALSSKMVACIMIRAPARNTSLSTCALQACFAR